MEEMIALTILIVLFFLSIIIMLVFSLVKANSLKNDMEEIVYKLIKTEEELNRISNVLISNIKEGLIVINEKTPELKEIPLIKEVLEEITEEITEEEKEEAKEEVIKEEIKKEIKEDITEEIKVDYVVIESATVIEELKPQLDTTSRPVIEQVEFSKENTGQEADKPIEVDIPRVRSAFELFFLENTLAKLGIVTFVLGIAFFVKYAIDHEWINEIGRVGIGILAGAILIGIAHKLKNSLSVFSSILVGGGISVFYITITLAFREYELFSQTTAFIILILITVFSVVLSLLYDRKELAVFSLLGGFAAPLMISTGQGNYIVLFSYILILNIGMLYLSYKKNWILIVYIAFVLTSLFQLSWVFTRFEDEYLGASIFAGLFFLQFYLVSIINSGKATKMILPHLLLITLNNMVFLGIYLHIFNYYEGVNFKGIITIAFAIINTIALQYLWKKKKIDKLYLYTILGLVVSLVTLAIPIQLKGHFITMFWATEIVVLLYLYIKSKVNIFYIGFICVSVLALVSYFIDIYAFYEDQNTTLIFNKMFITGLVVFASYLVALILLKKNDIDLKTIPTYDLIVKFLAFIVPFMELKKEIYLLDLYDPSFEIIALSTYSVSFAAIVFLVFSKSKLNYVLNWIVLGLFTLVYYMFDKKFNFYVFVNNTIPLKYFAVVFFCIPALVSLTWSLSVNPEYGKSKNLIRWLLPLLVLINCCILIDNISILIQMGGSQNESTDILYDYFLNAYRITRDVIYPIVWASIALMLTVVGIKYDKLILRKISIALLGLTIVKFYLIDVWKMSEGGKIISFVLLGIIILIISFLMNKIKDLLGAKEGQNKTNEKQD